MVSWQGRVGGWGGGGRGRGSGWQTQLGRRRLAARSAPVCVKQASDLAEGQVRSYTRHA
jgi:hypothetical protein